MTAPRSWRRRLAALMIFALAFVGLNLLGVAMPQTAGAIPGLSDCKDAPTPEVPGRGVESFFEPAPATPPPAADPFATGATTSIHEQYGYAGLRWNTYDLGCTGSPEASVGSTIANWVFTIPKAVVAATGAMLGASFEPQFLSVFDPLITTVTDALRRSVFEQWGGLVLAALGFLIIWRARRASLRSTAAAIGWAVLIMVIATVLFRWPLAAGQAADKTVTTTMSAVTTALDEHDASGRTSTGTLAANNLHDALLYQVWLGGEFGDANSVTARKYGAQLFDAQALTWSQAATLAQDPAAGQRIMDAKKAKWSQLANQIKSEDPDAYEYLTGKRSDARMGFAALALFAVACAVPFLLTAALLIVGALIITRFAVMMFPAIATLGLFPTMRNLVIGVGNTVAAAIINAMVFGLGSAVMVKAFGVIMAPGSGLPAWLVVALVLLLTLVMWVALRPFHRLTAMASPRRNTFADAAGALGTVTRGLGRVGGKIAGTAAGVVVGEGAAHRKEQEGDEKAGTVDDKAPRAEVDRRTGADGDGATSGGELASAGRRALGRGRSESGDQDGGGLPAGSGGSAAAASGGSGRSLLGRLTGGSAKPAESGELIAAEVGLPRAAENGRSAARSAPSEASGATRAPRAASAPAVPRPAPARRRRSEGFDVGDDEADLGAGGGRGPEAGGHGRDVDLSGDDLYAVYRPRERGSGRG